MWKFLATIILTFLFYTSSAGLSQQLYQQTPKAVAPVSSASWSWIGDSRTQQLSTIVNNVLALSANHYFNAANAINGHNMILQFNYGISGNRSDQYLIANLSTALADNSGWLGFGSPCVNDIAQASATPYTNGYGVSVTITNVAQVCAGNIIAAARQAVASGKHVLLVLETGSTSMTQAQVGAVFAVNEYLRDFREGGTFTDVNGVSYTVINGIEIWDPTPCVWNATSSTTAIAFKTGYSTDGTHFNTIGGYNMAVGNYCTGFAQWAAVSLAPYEQRLSNTAEVNATSALAILANPLFTTLTGGTTGGSGTITGNVPSGWKVTAPIASTSVTVTSAADAAGFGNDITLAITTAGADTIVFSGGPTSNSWWSIGDILQSGIDVSVASGSSHCAVQWQQQVDIDSATPPVYDMYAAGTGDGPTTAYAYTLQTNKQATSGTTKVFASVQASIVISAAGSCTLTFSRSKFRKRFSANDNFAMMEKVA